MWTRSELKTRAKEVLKKTYWKSFLISLVIAIANGSGGGSNSGRNGNHGNNYFNIPNFFEKYYDKIIIVIGVALLALAFRILLGYALEVGGRKYFVQTAQYRDSSGCFSYAFDGKNYRSIISAMFLKGLYNFLWSLLLIIPGIIKFYSYRMVPYILADNPNIGADKAIKQSMEMMDGHKFNMFVLDLSFIGWYFLGALAFGIGIIFVYPYHNATEAQLYLILRTDNSDNNEYRYERYENF